MPKNTKKTISNQQFKELFEDSDDDIDSTKDTYINFITDFSKWTIHHYYAIKCREKYPNMFFYYFPRSLFKISKIKDKEKSQIIDYIFNSEGKNLNGRWGYLSLLLENPNISGEQLFSSITNNRAIMNFSNSFPLKEDAKPDFDDDIKQKVKKILGDKEKLYDKVLSDFEAYLKEEVDKTKQKQFYNFIKNHENMYIYCDKSKNMNEFIKGIIEINEENNIDLKNNSNNNIVLLPENYKNKPIINKIEEKKNNESNHNSEDNIIKKNSKTKKRLVNKNELLKLDFDLEDSLDESNDNISQSEYKENKNGSKSKKIIFDEDELNQNLNPSNNKSKKSKKPKNSKRDISYKSEIVYLENNNKENQIKNDLDNKEKTNHIQTPNTTKNHNINYSTNLSSNLNLKSSNSNIEQLNNINIDNAIIQNKNLDNIFKKAENNYFNKENVDVEFYQNEQNLNGYISDFTKKVYYPKEINNKILVFSDNEDEFYLKKKVQKKKQKITRIKVNEPVIIKQKNNIRNYKDFVVIGMESGYIDKNIEKLRRGLMHKKREIKKRKNKKKRNIIINELKKQYKEEDFNNKKYQGNYKKIIREVKNLEKNKKYKVDENKVNNINYEEKKQKIRSKKGNYFDIASKKNFNMDIEIEIRSNNDLNINENKNERKYFNCFTNREKEDINFSDTESFLSLFKNPKNEGNIRKNKAGNKKFKLKDYYDISRNQNINTFFPKISKDNFIKDRQIVMSIRKLIDNEKYEELFNFIQRDINLDSKIPQYISDIYNKIFSYSNDIDFEKLNKYKTNSGYEINIKNNSDKSNEQEKINEIKEIKLIIKNQFDIEKLSSLFNSYLEKLQVALSYLFAESKLNNNKINFKDEQINLMELNVVENLLKLIIINMNITDSINYNEFVEYNLKLNNSSNKEYIKNEFSNYLVKIKNIFNDSFINILSEIYITFLRFFTSYKPKDIQFMDVEDFCFMSFTFLQIIQVMFQKIKELENINKTINNDTIIFNIIPNTIIMNDITNKYMKCLGLLLLNHLFIYSPKDFIPLVIKNVKKGGSFDKSSSPQESLILVALFKSISSLYIEMNSSNEINREDNSFIMLDNIFSEYINNEIDVDTSSLGSLNELLIKELRFYLSSNLNNCLSKEKKKLSIIGNIKKVFLYNCFEIDNLIENHFCIRQMINKKIIVNLIQRYLFVLISYFIYYRKNIDSLKYFNEFYLKYNNATAPNNQNASYFDVESIKEIIDKNIKLNLNKYVKNYLVEEYIYSDIQLMNFYDQYWKIDFNSKKDFIKNYFQIMCNDKYKSRKIDDIFQKNEILSLINSIFEFNQQNIENINMNELSNEEDISIENENKKDNIVKSFDSILIKAIYMISESINRTLISPEVNNNENKIKSNLSRIIMISNIFVPKISQLNSNYYTLFIIPMISTILIFTQHLLKYKEGKNIEITINKIKDILKVESSGLMLKSFSLSLWINIIQKISEKNINIGIEKYIQMINVIIHHIVEEYHKPQIRGFSMQMYTNSNYINWNKNQEIEYFEIMYDYLKSINNFAKNNPNLLIKNYSILNEIYDILNIQFYYPPSMRIQLIEIISILINHINKGTQQINDAIFNQNNILNNDHNNDDVDEIMFNALNNNMINSLFNEDEENYKFYKFLQEKIVPNIKHILDIFISTENTNVINKKKILYPLYEENALLYSNIFGLLIKNRIKQNHLEYPSYVFNLYYNKDNERNNIFDSAFQNYYSNKNDLEKESYIKLPFRLLYIYLDYYPNLINDIINDKSFILIIKYYLELFFIGIFVNNKKNNLNYITKYCEKIFADIKLNKDLLLLEKEKIKNEYKLKNYISEENKNKICLINLLLVIAQMNDENFKIGSKEFDSVIIGEILAKLSLNFNFEDIDSEIFFEIINGQKTKIALNKINKLSNFSNKYNNLQIFSENEINVRLYILSKYQEKYIKSQLNNKFTSFIDDFIKELTGEQMLSSIVTVKLINSLLTKENNFSNKFQPCLIKVFNILRAKSSNLCNVLSLRDNEGSLKEIFTNDEINDMILRLIKRYNNNINLRHNIYNIDISFYLKDNILNKFVTDIPLDNHLSSNIFINLLKYISKNNNNIYSYNKTANDYYTEAIYYYVSLCNIMNKESKISEIIKSIIILYDLINNNNSYNINYISDLKSFYVFIFFLEKINSLISAVIRIEDLENFSNITNSFLSEDCLLSKNFLMKTISIIECFVSFMYQFILLIIQGYSVNNKYVHSFIFNKIQSIINKKSGYFNMNRNLDDSNNFMNEYLKEKYGKSIMAKGYMIVEKILNNIKIYSKNDEEINKKIDFIKFINFDGIQYLIDNSSYKLNRK